MCYYRVMNKAPNKVAERRRKGKPRLSEKHDTVRLSVCITDDLADKLDKRARRKGLTVSQLVREVLREVA